MSWGRVGVCMYVSVCVCVCVLGEGVCVYVCVCVCASPVLLLLIYKPTSVQLFKSFFPLQCPTIITHFSF